MLAIRARPRTHTRVFLVMPRKNPLNTLVYSGILVSDSLVFSGVLWCSLVFMCLSIYFFTFLHFRALLLFFFRGSL